MSGRMKADERLARLLAMVPWVVAENGPTVEEVCSRFGYTADELSREIEQLFMCGLYPFTADVMVEAEIIDGRVVIQFPYAFNRPLKLTPGEALALLAATSALLSDPNADRGGPLARGVAKLEALAGDDPAGSLEVELGAVDPAVLDVLRKGRAERRLVEIDYYSYGRDARTLRQVAPYLVHNSQGEWYASGYCSSANGVRRFRLDRVTTARLLDDPFDMPEVLPTIEAYTPNPDDPVVTLTVAASDRWVVEQYPLESQSVAPDGSVQVELRISEGQWLDRLLLRLGSEAEVDDTAESQRRAAARRVLGRYRTLQARQ